VRLLFSLCLLFFLLSGSFLALADNNKSSSSAAAASAYVQSAPDKSSTGIPYKQESDPYTSIIGSFIFVIGVLVAFFFLFSKHRDKLSKLGFLPVEQGRHLAILDRQKLHADNVVYLVSVDERKYLLVVNRTGTSISKIDD
jgi:flagellar biogenesis protein FliO